MSDDLHERQVLALERIADALAVLVREHGSAKPRRGSKRTPRLVPRADVQPDELAQRRAETALRARGYRT